MSTLKFNTEDGELVINISKIEFFEHHQPDLVKVQVAGHFIGLFFRTKEQADNAFFKMRFALVNDTFTEIDGEGYSL